MTLLFFWIFLGLMALGVPIVFGLGIAPMVSFIVQGKELFLSMIVQRTFAGINQFPLMAIPFFILAGELMNRGGITQSLVAFANALVGHLRGGLAHVNIVTSMLFAGISGSAVADTSGVGSIMIPAMEKDGYSRKFAAAVTAASSVIGPIIPPSIIMVVYAFMMNVSVAGLFAAGVVPGLLVGFALMAVTAVISKRRNYPKSAERASIGRMARTGREAALPLLTPVIILGGIVGGVFTPTEAAAIAAFYALILSVFVLKTLAPRELPQIFLRAAVSSGAILLVVGTATAFAWAATLSQIPALLSGLLFSITEEPYLLLFLINVLLLIVGMFLDAGPAILILGPILAPTMVGLGIDPLHFAIIMCVNLTVGLATPPMGLILFVASSLTKLSIEVIAREMLPFLLVEIGVIFLITYLPPLTMTLPRLLGFA
ncbi:MAG: TRAP transporter large permease subunit [Alphaproteobacteria bacterium]|nr:TRAP transporter large permease subunit [Alphaproteobacteria bacterium]MCB9928218.1 TRAP transporter large permease subunit [Alphaproteobacteria bacterium]